MIIFNLQIRTIGYYPRTPTVTPLVKINNLQKQRAQNISTTLTTRINFGRNESLYLLVEAQENVMLTHKKKRKVHVGATKSARSV
jgi:hypothetical protein